MSMTTKAVMTAIALFASAGSAHAQTYYMREQLPIVPASPAPDPVPPVSHGKIATSIRITAGIQSDCIQVAELEAYSGGVNVALASNGGTASSSGSYSNESGPSNAIDGIKPSGYPNIYHSLCNSGDFLVVSFAGPKSIDSITLWGRTDYGSTRDIYTYTLMNGGTVVATGVINATSGSGSATP